MKASTKLRLLQATEKQGESKIVNMKQNLMNNYKEKEQKLSMSIDSYLISRYGTTADPGFTFKKSDLVAKQSKKIQDG